MTEHPQGDNTVITPKDLMSLGSNHIAYVREITVEGEAAFGVFSADGRMLGAMEDRRSAFLAARQNELMPQSVH